MRLGSTVEEQSPPRPSKLSSFKIGIPGIKSVIYMDCSFLKLDQVSFFVVNGSFKAY